MVKEKIKVESIKKLKKNKDSYEKYNNDKYGGLLVQYLNEIDNFKLLTKEEEDYLAKRSYHGDKEARNELIKANLRFVVSVAKKYQNRGLPLLDLINEGNMGLITAAEKFDYRKGFHFISYAIWWIRQSILKALSEKTKLIRLPLNRANQLRRVRQIKKEENNAEEPSENELAEILHIQEGNLHDIINAGRDYVSLDAPFNTENNEANLMELLEDSKWKDPLNNLIEQSLTQALLDSLEELTFKEKEILKLRYGIDGTIPLSLREIGARFNLTKERIRQIEKKAIKRLRHLSCCNTLKAFL